MRARLAFLISVVVLWLAVVMRAAHTIGDPAPFHLSPGDFFQVTVSGATFPDTTGVEVRFTPAAGGADVNAPAESVVPNTSVGARVPAALPVGEYNISVVIAGTVSDPPARQIWVRTRPFRFIARPLTYVPGQPASTHFKSTDFADMNNDGFLDLFESNSTGGGGIGNRDQLHTNYLGVLPAARPCAGDLCDETGTKYEQIIGGVEQNERTYDADLVDLDLDSDLDLVRIDMSNGAPVRLFINNGTGSFVDRSVTRPGIGPAMLPPLADMNAILTTGGNGPSEVDPGDVDGDGRPDLLVCNWGTERNLLLLNRLSSTGTFIIGNPGACGGPGEDAFCQVRSDTNRGCAFGNFNNDTRLDIILPSLESANRDIVLINDGNNASGIPQFTVHTDWVKAPDGVALQAPASGGNAKVADLDGDNDDDVAIAGAFSETGRILWNDNGTKLVQLGPTRSPLPSRSYNINFGDLDRDGDLDVLFAPYGGGLAQAVLINRGGKNGQMLFEAATPSAIWFRESAGAPVAITPSFELSVNPGDYDLDGDLDLLTGGFSEVRVFRNSLFDEPGEDRDWIFAQDRTRSMISGGKDFFEPSKNVLRAFLAARRPGDRAGLVSFDYTGSDAGNPAATDDMNKAQVEFDVGTRTPVQLQTDVGSLMIGSCSGFCTAIGWAIRTAREVAAAAPPIAGTPPREKVIVLLTDGAQNQAPHPDTIIPTLPSDVRLYTVALGSETDDRMLSALATNGGKFYFAGRSTDYASVQSTLREVDEAIEGHATGKQPLMPLSRLWWSPVLREVFSASPLVKRHRVALEPTTAVLAAQLPTQYFMVDPADSQVRFTLSWRQSSKTNRMILVDPKGRTYPIAGTRERRDDRSHVIEVSDPLSGVWQLQQQIEANSGPPKATAIASSALRFSAEQEFPLFYLNEPFVMRATLSEPIAGVRAQALITSPSKVQQVVQAQVNERTIEVRSANLTEPGTYHVEMVAFGPANRPFARHFQSAVHVAQPTPEEVDQRNAELQLDRTTLSANGNATATATLRLRRRDGSPFTGGKVSFVTTRGTMTGTVQEAAGGRYTQTLTAGTEAGAGVVQARVDSTRLPPRAEFTLTAGAADPKKSRFDLLVGPLKLCTNQQGNFALRVIPVDAAGNPVTGATVEIEKTSGPSLRWDGPTRAVGHGEVYERRFWGPRDAAQYRFEARVNGVPLEQAVSLDVFDPNSAEGRLMSCVALAGPPPGIGELPWWIWLLLLLLLLLLLFWWLRRRMQPAVP